MKSLEWGSSLFVEKQVGRIGHYLTWILHLRAAAVVHVVPFPRNLVLHTSCIVTAIQAAIVIRNSVQIIKHWLWFILQCQNIRSHIKAFNWEVNLFANFLLLTDLSVGEVEKSGFLIIRWFLRSESLQLQDHHSRYFVELDFLCDVSVLLTHAAIPLVGASKYLTAFITHKATCKGYPLLIRILSCKLVPWQ